MDANDQMTAGGGISRRKLLLGALAGLAADASKPAIRPAGARTRPGPASRGPQAAPASEAAALPVAPDMGRSWADGGRFLHADRPSDGIDIRYIVIHDIEGSYVGMLDWFRESTNVGPASHYVVRSADGRITQAVPPERIALHTGNFWYNMHSIGIEHEGYLAHGHRWYTEAQYRSSAKLVRYLAARFNIPLDRDHIIGHEEIPGEDPAHTAGQHYDPGPFWDWSHYFDLLGAPLATSAARRASGPEVVAIMPRFADNLHALQDCTNECVGLDRQASNVVYLYTEPNDNSPLIGDLALHPEGSPGTSRTWDWSARTMVGQRFVVADRREDWTAIWFGGRLGWFPDPAGRIGVPAAGDVVTPIPERDAIPVFGTAFPERSAVPAGVEPDAIVPLQYRIPAGQQYVAVANHQSDDYAVGPAPRHQRVHVVGDRRLVEISFNHRRAFVDSADVGVYEHA